METIGHGYILLGGHSSVPKANTSASSTAACPEPEENAELAVGVEVIIAGPGADMEYNTASAKGAHAGTVAASKDEPPDNLASPSQRVILRLI